MLQVMRHPNWQGTFRRAGLQFQANEPLSLTDEQCKAVASDIGVSLVLVHVAENSQGRRSIKVDWDETNKTREEIIEASQQPAKKVAAKAPPIPTPVARKKKKKPVSVQEDLAREFGETPPRADD